MKYIIITTLILLLIGFFLVPFLGKMVEGHGNMRTDSSGNIIRSDLSGNIITSDLSNNVISNTRYDNYNHFSGSSMPTKYYGPHDSTAQLIETGNAKTIVVNNPNGTTDVYYIDNSISGTLLGRGKYYGPNGSSANITSQNGSPVIQITSKTGQVLTYKTHPVNTSIDPTLNATNFNNMNPNLGSNYDSAFTTMNTKSNNYVGTNYDSSAYFSSNPQGIPKSQIPHGQEDLYILKSQVVPPVCPVCPSPIIDCKSENSETCPPCPACARCPEPSFECKKVPAYSSFNPEGFPVPVLNDFSTFGM